MSAYLTQMPLTPDSLVQLSEDESHHIRVKRHRQHEELLLTDNQGKLARARIQSLDPLTLLIVTVQDAPEPYPLQVNLALIEQKRLEWAVEKLTELNVAAVQLMVTARTQGQTLSSSKRERLDKVALAAQKQSHRGWPLVIREAQPLAELVQKTNFGVFGDLEDSGKPIDLKDQRFDRDNLLSLFVGPEGGWTGEERDLFIKHEIQPIHAGPLVLRSETAAIALSQKLIELFP